MAKTTELPIELESWAETHHEIVVAIHESNNSETPSKLVEARQESQGTGGLYMLAIELTNSFESKYKDVSWGDELDWHDTLEEFINEMFSQDSI